MWGCGPLGKRERPGAGGEAGSGRGGWGRAGRAQGVPVRLEVGPRDMEGQSVVLCRRDTGAKCTVSWPDLTTAVPALLQRIQVSHMHILQVCMRSPVLDQLL